MMNSMELAVEKVSPFGLHADGINLRQLGVLRSLCKSEYARKLILSAMIARVAKDELKDRMLDKMREVQVPSDEPFKKEVVRMFNLLLGVGKTAKMYWSEDVLRRLNSKFILGLTLQEQDSSFDLRTAADVRILLYVFVKLTGIKLRRQSMEDLMDSIETFRLVDNDVESVDAITFHLSAVNASEAFRLLHKVQKKHAKTLTTDLLAENRRQLDAALEAIKRAHEGTPTCPMVLLSWSTILNEMIRYKVTEHNMEEMFSAVYAKIDQTLKTWPGFPFAEFLLVSVLQAHGAKLKETGGDSARIQRMLDQADKKKEDVQHSLATWKPCGVDESNCHEGDCNQIS